MLRLKQYLYWTSIIMLTMALAYCTREIFLKIGVILSQWNYFKS
jgi:hypothetical protein